jgi:hypothetical protein
VQATHLHLFADASFTACLAVSIAVIEHSSGIIKGLLTSKSRLAKRNISIPRLELVSGQMASNMAKNLVAALRRWSIASVTVRMDSLVAFFCIASPERSWKIFVSNRTRKIAEITDEVGISWKYCPSEENLANLGSRGASIDKMEKNGGLMVPSGWLTQTNDQKNQSSREQRLSWTSKSRWRK